MSAGAPECGGCGTPHPSAEATAGNPVTCAVCGWVGVYSVWGYNRAAYGIARDAARYYHGLAEKILMNLQTETSGHARLHRVERGVEGTRTVRVTIAGGLGTAVLVLTAAEASRLYRELGDAIGAKAPEGAA